LFLLSNIGLFQENITLSVTRQKVGTITERVQAAKEIRALPDSKAEQGSSVSGNHKDVYPSLQTKRKLP
jgi:hypothetical protein